VASILRGVNSLEAIKQGFCYLIASVLLLDVFLLLEEFYVKMRKYNKKNGKYSFVRNYSLL